MPTLPASRRLDRGLVPLLACLTGLLGCGSDADPGSATQPAVTDAGDAGEDAGAPAGDAHTDAGAEDDSGLPDAGSWDATTQDTGSGSDVPVCAADVQPTPGVAVTSHGAVKGSADGGTWRYLAIPYAAPPVGPLRWRPPQPPACWSGVRDASALGAKCPQLDAKGTFAGAEDCLHLNVWTPTQTPPSGGWPVLFFIHGGGNIQGSNAQQLAGGGLIYGGRRLAEPGAVVVTANYRLGALGWLVLPELAQEAEGGKAGNYGLRDQLAALKWVQDNAGAFGGDPGRVLVFGESAGAVDTCALLATPAAKGLMHAAIMQSGGCAQPGHDATVKAHDKVAGAGGCGSSADRLTCLRGLTPEQILAGFPASIGINDPGLGVGAGRFSPVVDGALLPLSPEVALATGGAHKVPMVFGVNREESAHLTLKVDSQAALDAHIDKVFGPLGKQIPILLKPAYQVADYDSAQDALIALYSDMRFVCPSRGAARKAVAGGQSAVYRYHFYRRAKTAKGENPAAHGVELLYVFGSMSDIPLFSPHAEDLQVSAQMQTWWRALADKGAPGTAGGVTWQLYDSQTDRTLRIDATSKMVDGVRTQACDAWDAVMALLTQS